MLHFLPPDQEVVAGLYREECLQREVDALRAYFRQSLEFMAACERADAVAAELEALELKRLAAGLLQRSWEPL